LTAHLSGVLVGVEARKQMDNAIGQSHDGFDPGIFQRRFVEGTVRSYDTQPSLGAGVHSLDISLAAERVGQRPPFFGSKWIAKFRLDTSLWRDLYRRPPRLPRPLRAPVSANLTSGLRS
jgi:hypothetical protein